MTQKVIDKVLTQIKDIPKDEIVIIDLYYKNKSVLSELKEQGYNIIESKTFEGLLDKYEKGSIEFEFTKYIKELKTEYIVILYSDTVLISKKFILAVLKRYGLTDTLVSKKTKYIDINGDTQYDYLYFVKKNKSPRYESPLNYVGSKFKSLDFLQQYIPNNVDTFYDLFGGGANVALNVNANKIVYNDINLLVEVLLKYLAIANPCAIYRGFLYYKEKYRLEKGNKEGYNLLRQEYNETRSELLLFLLICYGFKQQIRFNSKHEFNNPCGNRWFNEDMYEKLISYHLRCKEINIHFNCNGYSNYLSDIKEGDFVYLDPPYLGTTASYQDGKRGFNGWDKEQEEELHLFIEELDKKGIGFAFSNCIEHQSGKENNLKEWSYNNGFLYCVDSKVTKSNGIGRREILITNKKEIKNE